MLDTHSQIWGMGEDSVFNANLTVLRDNMVKATDSISAMEKVLLDYGRSTVRNMKEMVKQSINQDLHKFKGSKGSTKDKSLKQMKYIVDKMLFNYRNIGKKFEI